MHNHNFIYPNNNWTYYGNAHTTHFTILHIHNSCIKIKIYKIVTLPEILLGHETFFNWYSGGGGWSPIGSTRHCGHQWPIVPAPDDYDDGEIGGMIV
jgi:hypothetical protein